MMLGCEKAPFIHLGGWGGGLQALAQDRKDQTLVAQENSRHQQNLSRQPDAAAEKAKAIVNCLNRSLVAD